MHRTQKLFVRFAVFATLFALVSGAIFSDARLVHAQKSSVLRVGGTITADLDGLDPHVRTGREIAYMENFYEALVGFDGEQPTVRSLLAESWSASPDGSVWTFKLRKNVKFHDGTSFKADAVQYALDRIYAIKQSPAFPLLQDKVKSFKVIDDFTVQFTVNKGGPPFLQLVMMVLMASPTAGKKNDKGDVAQAFFRDNPIGTGPYRLERWEKGSLHILRKFPDYWGGWQDDQFTAIIYQVIPEASTQQLMLERGDLDIAQRFPAESLPALRRNPAIVVEETPGFRVLLMRMNMVASPTKDVRVRKALALAFDYEGYAKTVSSIVGPNTGPVPAAMMRGWVPENLPKFDLSRARSLMAEAGVPAGTSFHVLVARGVEQQSVAAQILQAGLRKIGYDVKIDIQEFSDWSQRIVNWVEKENLDAARKPSDMFNLVVPPRIPDAWAYLWFNYHSEATRGAGRNWYQYRIQSVDELIDKGSEEVNESARLDLFKRAVRKIVDDQPDVFYGNELRISVRRKTVKGFEFHPAWFPEMHFYPVRRGE